MISVCIATYNGEKFIKEQLISILSQLEKDDEVIISDDNSTDCTLSLIYELNDSRIRILNNQKKKYHNLFDYTTHNFENALNYTSGNIIFLSDQDDIWLPNKVKIMSKALQNNLLVLSDCMITDISLKVIHNSYFSFNKSRPGIYNNLLFNSFLGSCMAFRREILNFALPFPLHSVPHDIWIGLIGSYYGKVCFLPMPLIFYRRHTNTVSTSGKKSSFSIYFRLSYRLKILLNLIIRIIKNKSR